METGVVEALAPVVVGVVFMIVIAAVILLRPIVGPLGELLRTMTEERRSGRSSGELERVREVLASIDGRLSLLEERQRFTETLLDAAPVRARVAALAERAEPG
jgi:hypothetical protein